VEIAWKSWWLRDHALDHHGVVPTANLGLMARPWAPSRRHAEALGVPRGRQLGRLDLGLVHAEDIGGEDEVLSRGSGARAMRRKPSSHRELLNCAIWQVEPMERRKAPDAEAPGAGGRVLGGVSSG
jgi:hypothetical protein